jgi:hypothetical protein
MERVLYVVTREQPLLVGYLLTTMSARPADGRLVEIKLDERRAERRLSRDAREPERRQGDRRRQPSLAGALRSRGYATVIQSVEGSSRPVEPTPEPAMVWRSRSTWRQRAARAGRRRLVRWGMLTGLLAAFGVSIVAAWSIRWAPAPSAFAPPPHAPQIPPRLTPPQLEKASPPPAASRAVTVAPTVAPPAPSTPPPVRIVSTRSSGVVVSVDPSAGVLVLDDRGAAGAAGRLRVELAPDARVVLSERVDQAEDPSRPFKETLITLPEIGRGDYVVVERRGPDGKQLAHSIVVTFRNMR